MDQELAAELVGVTKQFGSFTAVNDIDLAIRRGEFLSLLGPSGCGKSTTLRLLGGFEFPTRGNVIIAGKVANRIPPYKRDTNLVFQQLALFPHLDVERNVGFGLQVKRVSKGQIDKKVQDILDLVGLGGFRERSVRELSGGQQQRVAIARALVNEPAVLLLDEPLGALDLKLRLQMQLELKSLQNRLGTTFVYVTHDQSEALTMSDRIAVMNHGRIEQLGSSEEVYGRPVTKFVAGFVGDTNFFPVTDVVDHGNSFELRSDGLRFVVERGAIRPVTEGSLSLRPERVRIGNASKSCAIQHEGWITEVILVGSTVTYVLESAGNRVKSLVANNAGPLHSPGELVTVGWNPGDPVYIAPPAEVKHGST